MTTFHRQFLHEQSYRGQEQMARLAQTNVTLCGAGAIGSHLAENLARQGWGRLKVIDRDRVEEHNIGTQVYGSGDIGAWKTHALRNRLFRGVEVEIEAIRDEITPLNAGRLLQGAEIVIDALDNSAGRGVVQQTCRAANIDCLHVGLYEDYCEVVWDEQYRVPADVDGDVCEYPLARNLVLLAVALASETLARHLVEGERLNRTATLRDFAVLELVA